MKISVLFLLLQFLILIVVSQPVKKLIDIDNTRGNIVSNQARRCKRTLRPPSPPCRINQYFDEEEGRCLGIAGGGKALFIDNTRSCGTNVLKPHCTNPKYYYVCKRKKMILVQCTQDHQFENRLQKCVHVGDRAPIPNTVQPNVEMPESIQVPTCQVPGSFPVPFDCGLFYTCESTGHRLLQNIFKCPMGMVFDVEVEMCIPSASCIQPTSNLFLPPCTPDAGRNVTVLPDRDETGKIQDSMSREDDYSEPVSSDGKRKPTICETIFTDGYTEDIATTTNNYEGTETLYDEEKFSTTTLSYTEALIQQTPQEFMVFTDNSDITTSTEGPAETSRSSPAIAATTTVTYSTMIKDDVEGLKKISSYTEMATSKSSVETSTVEEVTSSEQSGPILGEIEISGTTEGTSSTQMGSSEPSFETSTLEEVTSSEQNDPIVGAIHISSTTEGTSSTQMGTSEASFETSTLEEVTSSEQNDPIAGKIEVSSTTQESSFPQTGASEPSIETSTLKQYTLSEQNDSIVGEIEVSSTTEETSSTQSETSEPSLETSTLNEFTSNKEYKPTGADEGVINNIEEETTEHLTTETEITESTPTYTHSNSSNEGMTSEPTVLLNDAFLFAEDLPDTNEEITKTDVESTTQTFASTENSFALNDVMTTDATITTSIADELPLGTDNITTENNTEIPGETFVPTESTPTSNKIATIGTTISSSKNDNATTEASAEDTSQTSTPQAYKMLDTVEETTTTSMESSTESAVTHELLESRYPENTSPDFAFSTSTEAATSSSTVFGESFDNKTNELVGDMEEFRYNSTATPDIASSTESELLTNDISSNTPPDIEAYNKTVGQIVKFMNDITLALNAALSSETTDVSSSTAMPDIGGLNETVGALQQLMSNFSSTLNSISLLGPEARAKYNEENKALPIYIPIYDYTKKGGNIDDDDKNILANVCAMLATSPVKNETDAAATGELSNKTGTQDLLNTATMSKLNSNESAETAKPFQTTLLRQNGSAAEVTDPRRTISKHIVLPLTSSVLNITDKFERRLREIFRNLSKLRNRS